MSRVEFSPRASRSLQAIRRHLARNAGPRTALEWVQRIRGAALDLSALPDRGGFDEDVGMRRLVVRPYLVFYVVGANGRVLVADVVDGRRDLATAFRDDVL